MLDLKFSPDGTRLATCSRDMSILIYAIKMAKVGGDDDGGGGGGGGGGGDMDEDMDVDDRGWYTRRNGNGCRFGAAGASFGAAGTANGRTGGAWEGGGGGGEGSGDDAAEVQQPFKGGGLSVRLIHRLRRSATASVGRIFW